MLFKEQLLNFVGNSKTLQENKCREIKTFETNT